MCGISKASENSNVAFGCLLSPVVESNSPLSSANAEQ